MRVKTRVKTTSALAAAMLATAAALAGCGGDDDATTGSPPGEGGATSPPAVAPSPTATDPEPVVFTPGAATAARSAPAPGAVLVQNLGDVELVLFSVGTDGTVTENWRFTPKIRADNPVQDVLGSPLRPEDFTPDLRQIAVVKKERAEPIGFSTRVGLHGLDGDFTDLSGYGAKDPARSNQSRPAVHHPTKRLWYWQYQNREHRLMSVGLDGADRRHESATQQRLPRAAGGRPFHFVDADQPIPVLDGEKPLVVTADGSVGAQAGVAGAGVRIGDPLAIDDAKSYSSAGYQLVRWLDDTTLLGTATKQLYSLKLAGDALTETPLIPEMRPPWRLGIGRVTVSPDGALIVFTTASPDDRDAYEVHSMPTSGGEPVRQAIIKSSANNAQFLGWSS